MKVCQSDCLDIDSEFDIVKIRQQVKQYTTSLKLNAVGQTKVITAASEIARNTLIYGGGGQCILEIIEDDFKTGLRLSFIDHGPGIIDINKAMEDGYTTGKGMGLGLSGSKRLMDEFWIKSVPNEETCITMIKWK